jgi:hypothetical protein
MACAPCVARPSRLPERVAAIQAAIRAETEPLVILTHLLQLCRDEHPVLRERASDPGSRAQVAPIVAGVAAVLPASATPVPLLGPRVRRALAAALTASGEVPAVVVARALAELLDERCWPSFAGSFRGRSPYQPGVGDPVPLDSPDLRQVTALPATSPPWRLANRLDETRHVRLAGGVGRAVPGHLRLQPGRRSDRPDRPGHRPGHLPPQPAAGRVRVPGGRQGADVRRPPG